MITTTDPLDLVDPVRLVLSLLPEAWRAPVGALLSVVVATQLLASMIVARLPLGAREHPRWGRLVRALHWYAVVRLRNEMGTLKLPGAAVAPRVGVAPLRADEIALGARIPEAIEPEPRRRDPQGGSVDLGALISHAIVGVVVLIVLSLLLFGCHPPSDCQAGRDDVRCSPTGVPQRCDANGRWRSWATRPCEAVDRVCVARNGHALCVRDERSVR